jgi:hypothetical protein
MIYDDIRINEKNKISIMLQMDKRPGAWVCTNENNAQTRGRKKVYQPGSKIYLNDNQEFEIELYNPCTFNVLAKIEIDGKDISPGGLVIKSGQRVYLECFPSSKKKFTFKTYTVKNSKEVKEAISNNGNVKINFFKEQTYIPTITTYAPTITTYNSSGTNYFNDVFTTTSMDSMNISNTSVYASLNDNSNFRSKPTGRKLSKKNIETGQVEGGNVSNQNFTTVDMNFESWVYTSYFYKLLPKSQEPSKPKDFKSNVKIDLSYKNKGEQMLEKIKELKTLLDDNLISEDEFNHMKDLIISS